MSTDAAQPVTLGRVAAHVGAEPPAEAGLVVTGVNTLADAAPGEVAFYADKAYAAELAATRAAALLVSKALLPLADFDRPVLAVDDAAFATDLALDLFNPGLARPAAGVHTSATVSPTATFGANVSIGPSTVVGDGCVIGDGTVLHANVTLGANVTIGRDCELMPGVAILDRCTLGDRVRIHANSAVGTDGFGYRFTPSPAPHHRKIAHVGTVVIEDDVEIGSCTTIDRGKFAQTRIGAGTKIDNLVQIAHNVRIGRLCIVCGCAAIAGSSIIEDGVVLAGGAGIKDHVRVGARSIVGGFSGVMADVPPGQTYVGVPAAPQREFRREQATVRRLPELVQELRDLRRRVATLEEEAGKRPGVAE